MSGLSPMYAPQGRRGSPQQRGTPLRALAREKGKATPPSATVGAVTTTMATVAATAEEGLALAEALMGSPDMNGGGDGTHSETEVWRRFQTEGALDMPSLERKDRAALHARIAALEAEVKNRPLILPPLLGRNCHLQ
jgi:hypothetical protein